MEINSKIVFPNGQEVCPLGQGTWKMGQVSHQHSEEIRAIRRGVELGLNLIDTAEMYGNEKFVGEAIRNCRNSVFFVSKVLPSHASHQGTKLACERSLQQLGVECIDLYLLHWKGNHPFAETVEAMNELYKEGKIRMWGMSNLDVVDMESISSLPKGEDCATDQVLYNLANRGVEFDLIPWCQQHGMPVMAYSPIGEGELLHNCVLADIARRHNATPAQIALAWTMRLSNIIAIPKAGNITHVENNYQSLFVHLTDEDLRELNTSFPVPIKKVPLAGW